MNVEYRTSNVERPSVETICVLTSDVEDTAEDRGLHEKRLESAACPAVASVSRRRVPGRVPLCIKELLRLPMLSNRRGNHLHAIAIVATAVLTWLTVLDARAKEDTSSSTNDAIEALMPPAPRRRPLVVLKQTTIKGRVFLLTEKDGEAEETAAANLPIEVCLPGEDEPIYKVQTDNKGFFSLPNLDMGKYELKVGRLILELRVEEPQEGPTYARRIPKTILVFMPAGLRD